MQAAKDGGLPESVRQYAIAIARGTELRLRISENASRRQAGIPLEQTVTTTVVQTRDARLPMPGSLIVKKYKDQTLVVKVLERGIRIRWPAIYLAQRDRRRDNRHALEWVCVFRAGEGGTSCAVKGVRRKTGPASAARAGVRCGIYTRKSTEEGLDQAFNTLDAQREAAESFINSQRQEGWMALPQKYDDGGYTGANMDRPALKRLLADVQSGAVNCVVVYKVDRLSRSLLDFARIMEILDKHGATFVSVTQQFNTTSSMGRLTLNVLLSFAQFEREMISERTRDKMSAARRKGKWVGGNPVIGYDVAPQGGSLVVNQEEAQRVREIFALYLELGSLIPVVEELDRRGWRMKSWTTREGRQAGGKPIAKNSLYNLLTNMIYVGKVEYGGKVYDGEHERIVDDDTWNKVQTALNRNGRRGGRNIRQQVWRPAQRTRTLRHLRRRHGAHLRQQEGQALSLLRVREGPPAGLGAMRDAIRLCSRPWRTPCWSNSAASRGIPPCCARSCGNSTSIDRKTQRRSQGSGRTLRVS